MEIIAKNVSKVINNQSILKKVDLHVKSGEIYGLIGPNGAGKSTFTRLLLGIYNLSSGSITIDGISVNSKNFINIKSKIGCVLDHLGLYKDLTAWENIEFFHRIYFPNATQKDRNKDILSVLDLVDLNHKKDEKITMFSKGQKQRLALARAFINNPKLLILDEPTVGLDVEGVFMVREYIENAKKCGTTVFLNSHNLSELQKICDKYGFIKNGVLLQEASFNSLINKYASGDKDNADLEFIYKKIFSI